MPRHRGTVRRKARNDRAACGRFVGARGWERAYAAPSVVLPFEMTASAEGCTTVVDGTTSAASAGRTTLNGGGGGASAVAPATVAVCPVTIRLKVARACAVTWSIL